MASPDPQERDLLDDEALSAWLAGDLSGTEAEALDRRLAVEPALAARLEALHHTLLLLRGVDEVVPPDGAGERLRRRLALERDAVERRGGGRWSQIALRAAAAVLVGVVGVGVVPRLLQSGEDVSSDEPASAPAGATGEEAGRDMSRLTQDGTGLPLGPVVVQGPPLAEGQPSGTAEGQAVEPREDDASQEAAEEASPQAPAQMPRTAVAPVEDRLRPRFVDVPEAEALLGVSLNPARALAGRFAEQIVAAPAFDSGVVPGACLEAVTQGEDLLVVPARVESFTLDGREMLAYVLVGASEDSESLDRVEVWVVDPATCATSVFLSN